MLLSALLPSWKLALDAAGKSPKTISSFLDSAKRLEAYLTTEGLPHIRRLLARRRRQRRRSSERHPPEDDSHAAPLRQGPRRRPRSRG